MSNIEVFAKLMDISCRFPLAYQEMHRYYLAYAEELESFVKREAHSHPILQDNFKEFETRMKYLIRVSGHNLTLTEAMDYFRSVEDARQKIRG